jgi:hypothetical protein
MAKKTIDMVAITPAKANAQQSTCFITFLATGLLAIGMMLVACVLPAMMETVTETICWISMGLEAVSIGLGYVAAWIKRNAL